jgi:SRSO17 transposase
MVLASNDHISIPLCLRLYLPEAWVTEPARKQKGGVPNAIEFATRPKIALEQIRRAIDLGVPPRLIVAREEYGGDTSFHDAVADMGLPYLLRVPGMTTVFARYAPGTMSAADGGASLLRNISLTALATSLPAQAFETVHVSGEAPASGFASVRVFQEGASDGGSGSLQEKWLLVERPANSGRPANYWISNLPAAATTGQLAEAASRYWRAETALFELKDHLGLGHYEGRGWRGFHHHATLCIAVYNFLVAEFARTNRLEH